MNYDVGELKNALRQLCLQCKTKESNCNKKKCKRYNVFKNLVDEKIKENENMNENKLYDVAEEMGLKVRKLHPDIWAFDKMNKNSEWKECVVMYYRKSKYYSLTYVADKLILYYGHSIDDLIKEMKEFYRRNG